MSNTYSQIYIHVVTAVRYRSALIDAAWKDPLHQFIKGVVHRHGHEVLAINSMPDHLHLFFSFWPTQSLADLMREVKGESSEWINKERLSASTFRWQEGYGAFSYARSQVNHVIHYIEHQEAHHHIKSFPEEYRESLRRYEMPYEEQNIFHELE